jgi:Na+/proline symporter
MSDENIRGVYDQLSTAYHAVDDFRARLIGLLPLASGVAFIGLLDPTKTNALTSHLREIGLLGMVITFGLLIYELKGIKKCTDFIFSGEAMEQVLLKGTSLTGKFTELTKSAPKFWKFATEPVASAIVYATVMAGWTFVASSSEHMEKDKLIRVGVVWPSIIVWVVIFAIVIAFWLRYKQFREHRKNDTPDKGPSVN